MNVISSQFEAIWFSNGLVRYSSKYDSCTENGEKNIKQTKKDALSETHTLVHEVNKYNIHYTRNGNRRF